MLLPQITGTGLPARLVDKIVANPGLPFDCDHVLDLSIHVWSFYYKHIYLDWYGCGYDGRRRDRYEHPVSGFMPTRMFVHHLGIRLLIMICQGFVANDA